MIKTLYRMAFGSEWEQVKIFLVKSLYVFLTAYYFMILLISENFFGFQRLTFDAVLSNQFIISIFPPILFLVSKLVVARVLMIFAILVVITNYYKLFFSLHLLIILLNAVITAFTYPLRDGGVAMLDTFLILSLFWLAPKNSNKESDVKKFLSNLSFIIFRVNLLSMYLSAVLLKVSSQYWQKGVALYYILTPPDWSTHYSNHLAKNSVLFVVLGTYSIMLLQLVYPVLLATKRTKLIGIICIMLFHLGIIFFMRLFYFGLIMMIFNLVFLNDWDLIRIKNYLKKKKEFFV